MEIKYKNHLGKLGKENADYLIFNYRRFLI